MPLAHFTKVFAVTDAKVYKLLTDPVGGPATYGTAIDVPGIKSVAIKGTVDTKQLRGDNQALDSDSVLTGLTCDIEHAKLSLDIIALMFGAAVVDAGTTPSQTATLDILGSSKPQPFKLTAVSASADVIGGNVGFTLWKCVPNAFPDMGLAEEDYQTSTWGVDLSPLIANNKWLSPSINETALVLA